MCIFVFIKANQKRYKIKKNKINEMLRVAEEEIAKDNISDQAKYLIDQKIEVLRTIN